MFYSPHTHLALARARQDEQRARRLDRAATASRREPHPGARLAARLRRDRVRLAAAS